MNQILFYSSWFTAIVMCIICYINYVPEYIVLYFFTFLGIVTSILNHGYYTNPDKLFQQSSAEISDVIERFGPVVPVGPVGPKGYDGTVGTKDTFAKYYKSLDRSMIAITGFIYLYFIFLLKNPLYIIISSVFIGNSLFCYFISKLMDDSTIQNSLHVFSHLLATATFYFMHIF